MPALSKNFEKITVLAPVSLVQPLNVTEFDKSTNLEIIGTKAYENPFIRLIQGYTWGFENLSRFNEIQKESDGILIAVPSAITYSAMISKIEKPLATLIAGDEQEVMSAANSPVVKFERKIGFLNLRQEIERKLTMRSRIIICRNEKFRNKLINSYKIEKDRIRVISSGVRTDFFYPCNDSDKKIARAKFKIDDDDVVIGFVAENITISKGYDNLIKIFTILKKDLPKIRLLIIGSPKNPTIDDPSIIYSGYIRREELPKYYSIMDIFLFPTRSEGVPKVILEAGSCEIPVVTTNVGGIPDVIENGETGYVSDSTDVESMINNCRILIQDKDLRRYMGINARKKIIESFDFKIQIEKTANTIKEIIN